MRHLKAFNTGVGLVTCVCVLTVFTLPAGAAAIIFRKVDTFTIEGTKEKKRDARLDLDTEKRLLLVVDEKRGAEKMTYAAIRMTPSRDFRILGRPTHEPSQALHLVSCRLGSDFLLDSWLRARSTGLP